MIENSRSAFAAAIAKGYAIECDLQRTSDGEAVVFHDDTVDRVMQGTGRVKDKTAAAMASLAFKGGFQQGADTGRAFAAGGGPGSAGD